MKFLLSGVAIAIGLTVAMDSAHAAIPIVEQCPDATWTEGYSIWDLIPLAPEQYKPAVVFGGSGDIRGGVGYDSPVLFQISEGSRVTIIGEAWDMGCNQWTKIRIGMDGNEYWIHGFQLQML
jgi:hypothetical protein